MIRSADLSWACEDPFKGINGLVRIWSAFGFLQLQLKVNALIPRVRYGLATTSKNGIHGIEVTHDEFGLGPLEPCVYLTKDRLGKWAALINHDLGMFTRGQKFDWWLRRELQGPSGVSQRGAPPR